MKRVQLEAIASSILIYLIIIVTIFSIAIYDPDEKKAKNFVEKKSDIIEVSLGSPVKPKSTKSITQKRDEKKEPKKTEKKEPKKVVKKVRNIKETSKTSKPIKHTKKAIKTHTKRVKPTHKKPTKTNKRTKPTKASSLFKKLPKGIKDDKPINKRAGKSGKSIKKVNQGKGLVDKYKAKVTSILRSWQAQSNFAGEKIKIELIIYSTGLFEYKILSHSLNPELNKSLKSYLDRLKSVGFGPHSSPKPLNFTVIYNING